MIGRVALLLAVGLWACDDGPGFHPLPARDGAPAPDAARPVDAQPDMPVARGDDFGEPCTEGTECQARVCVAAEAGRVCTRTCGNDDECPDGWLCRQVTNTGADITFVCAPEEAPCAGADLATDPDHCGACGHACAFPGAEARCVDSACALGACLDGFHDLDGLPATGCEYGCRVTRAGMEACDEIDNDCDGGVDEGIDTTSSLEHCGGCGQACSPANAEGQCVASACGIARCLDGFVDADGRAGNGCEVGCQATNEGVEACDRIDNDCDGQVDEGFDLQSDSAHCGACGRPCALPNADAMCTEGTCAFVACRSDFYDRNDNPADGCEVGCQRQGDGQELCNAVDDDCDGRVDEGFDLDADPAHCGGCATACARPQAQWLCMAGRCRFVGCEAGFHDADGLPETGCEYACAPTGAEQCNGLDDDCDGRTDEDFDLQGDVTHCGACDRVCGAPGAVNACLGGRCGLSGCLPGFGNPDGNPANGCECAVAGPEACNGRDDDCDGVVDEGQNLQNDPLNCGACGRACAVPGADAICVAGACALGRCRPGFGDADGAPDNGCECAVQNGGTEICDGLDQDCDGRVDEGFDLGGDVRNCGACGRRCLPANAAPLCAAGQCRVDTCVAGFGDADGNPANGCECRVANGGVERCDQIDDDCDGRVDEGFDLQGDLAHCGACGRVCAPAHADGLCAQGQCRVDACAAGFVDADGNPANGCEVECAVNGAGVPGCPVGVVYPGIYGLDPAVRYTCRDVIFGEVVVSINFQGLVFRNDGGTLNVLGANTPLSQTPIPADGTFNARGVLDGGCREIYELQGSFQDADTWTGLYRISFEGFECGFTDCRNQALPVTGRRR